MTELQGAKGTLVTYTVGDASASSKERVTVDLSVSDEHYMVGGELRILYDATKLKPVAVSKNAESLYLSQINTAVLGEAAWTIELVEDGVLAFTFVNGNEGATGSADGGMMFALMFDVLKGWGGETAVDVEIVRMLSNDGVSDGGADYDTTVAAVAGTVTVTQLYYGSGDVNLDGEVSLVDALMLFHYVNARISLTEEQLAEGELTEPYGAVTINDALRLFHYVNNKIPTL